MDRVFTKTALLRASSVRLAARDTEAIIEAARIEGISRSEFLRRSSVERAKRVIKSATKATEENA